MYTLTLRWGDDDESFEAYLEDTLLISADHGKHGWAGMVAIRDSLLRAGEVAGWDIAHVGNPCV